MTPPTKVPRNWNVEKKPIEEPLNCVGTIFEVDDGNDASITLNDPIKMIRARTVYIGFK